MSKRVKTKQIRKENDFLSKAQRMALGPDPPKHIWTKDFSALYSAASEYFIDQSLDEVQSFPEFKKMEEKEPDELGQGRFKVEGRKTIGIFILPLLKKNRDFLLSCLPVLRELFEAYFYPLSVEILRPLELIRKGSTFCMIDKVRELEFPLKNIKGRSSVLDVFSLFDVMVEYVDPHLYSILAITDALIGDPEIPENEILGRACGDRVSCITVNENGAKLSMREIAQTAVHETMHTMGLDHCVLWRCIMNAVCADGEDGNNFMFTCPLDSRKLQDVLKYDNDERCRKLVDFFEKNKWEKEAEWVKSYSRIVGEI